MTNKEYWQKRERQARRNRIKGDTRRKKEIKEYYKYMIYEAQKEIDSFYAKYARGENITVAEAKKKASELDIEAYQRKAKKYVKDKDFSKQANEEMRIYNLTMKVNRLELLKAQMNLALTAGFDELDAYFNDELTSEYMAELKRMSGILGTTGRNVLKASSIVNASFKNATFSERIWGYKNELQNDLEKLLLQSLITGKHPKELAKQLQSKYDVSRHQAETLMVTEVTRVQIDAQKESYRRNGTEKYIYMAEDKACPICLALEKKAEKGINIYNMNPGTNAPPMHPWCKCTTAPYVDEDEYARWLDEVTK